MCRSGMAGQYTGRPALAASANSTNSSKASSPVTWSICTPVADMRGVCQKPSIVAKVCGAEASSGFQVGGHEKPEFQSGIGELANYQWGWRLEPLDANVTRPRSRLRSQ